MSERRRKGKSVDKSLKKDVCEVEDRGGTPKREHEEIRGFIFKMRHAW